MNGAEAAGPASVQPAACPSLLRGDYDETQSAASFQAALMAWRQGEQAKPVSHSPYSVDTAPGKRHIIYTNDIHTHTHIYDCLH